MKNKVKEFTVLVSDITVQPRYIKIGPECPKCGADLEKNAFEMYVLRPVKYLATFKNHINIDEPYYQTDIELDIDGQEEFSESDLPADTLICSCGYHIAAGEFRILAIEKEEKKKKILKDD